MEKNLIAKTSVTIHADAKAVWDALTNPSVIKKYMMGTTVKSDWKKGSKILWEGDYKGKKYADKGEILNIEPFANLKYSHFSPLSGQEDIPEKYHVVTIHLTALDKKTKLTLSQNKNATKKAQDESQKNCRK